MAVRFSVFVGASVDGFIARENGDLDFLPPDGGEPHGYDEFMASVDTVVIGRKTFETVKAFSAWPYTGKRVVVLGTRPIDVSSLPERARVEVMNGPPAELAAELERTGARHVYVDGGVTIQGFLRVGLVDRLVVTRVPVLIGRGTPLFGALDDDIKLLHVQTRAYPSGLVQTEYRIDRRA